jgi:endonuclease/exonuclease/phosphatase family metal-dependent hydrolase
VPGLRVLSYNAGFGFGGLRRPGPRTDTDAVAETVRSLAPDVVLVQDGPRRLRWRSRCADLAHGFGLVYAGGGEPALGNAIFVSLRVAVLDAWCVQFPLTAGRLMRGAVLARCAVAGAPVVLASVRLASHADERPAQASIMTRVLAKVDAPAVLGADVDDTTSSVAWRTLAAGRVDAGRVDAGRVAWRTLAAGRVDDEPPAAGRVDTGATVRAPAPRRNAIFVDPPIEVTGHRILPARAGLPSEGCAVLADLRLPEPGPV